MILFFDTETTGKALFKAPPSDPAQPMIVQIAALLVEPGGTEVASLNTLVKTDGWIIPLEVTMIHGITQEKADAEGIALTDAILQFDTLLEKATIVVAHNLVFDELILAIAYHKLSLPNPLLTKRRFCTMTATTNICRIRSPWGYKWPKLSEAYHHFFNEEFEGAHDALADVRACARVYFALPQ